MQEYINGVINQIFIGIVALIATFILVEFKIFVGKVNTYIDTYVAKKIGANDMEMLDAIGKQAYAFAENAYAGAGGDEKLKQAIVYFQNKADEKNIPFSVEDAVAAIKKAWLITEELPRRSANTQVNIPPATIIAPALKAEIGALSAPIIQPYSNKEDSSAMPANVNPATTTSVQAQG